MPGFELLCLLILPFLLLSGSWLDDPAKEKWQAFEAIDENANVEIVSTVPEATDWNVTLFSKPGSNVVEGARRENSYPFLRYKTEDVSREEPLRIT